jgi:TRAP-type C4-dicarboxylate transport system permease large subunit
MSGSILFIVAAASSISFALAIQQIPAHLSDAMVALGRDHGATVFVAVSALLMIGFGAVLEGAPR